MLHACVRLEDVITCLNAALGVNHHALYEQLHRLFPHEGLRVNSLENDSLRLSSVPTHAHRIDSLRTKGFAGKLSFKKSNNSL